MIYDKRTDNHYLKTRDRNFPKISTLLPHYFKSGVYQKISQSCSHNQQKYIDPEFPTGPLAISKDPKVLGQTWQNLIWKRPHEIFGNRNYSIFNEINPQDLIHGSQAGYSDFTTILRILAERRYLVTRLFEQKTVFRGNINL